MQLLAKFKESLYMGFRAILYLTFKVALNPIPKCSLVIGQFFDTMIVSSIYRVVIMTHQNLTLGMCWKLF